MLRKLKESDAEWMLEWMHNEENTRYFKRDFSNMQVEDCREYIRSTWEDKDDFHFAVCDESEEYLGTISLKQVDLENGTAEYAISLRNVAMGKGVASKATNEILKFAFEKLNLNRVYLNVLADNVRARRFYEKYGFIYEGAWKEHYVLRGKKRDLLWFRILKEEWVERQS